MATALIGASGQLGGDLSSLLGPEAVALTHEQVELTDRSSLLKTLQPLAPCVVINSAAYNHVDDAETEPAEAFAVNAAGVRELSLVCRELSCVLVHFSTDYVFGLDANRHEPYDEQSLTGPVNVYGMSKLAGEYAVQSICPRHYLIRTCGLYGPQRAGGKGTNFVETMLRIGRQRGQVRVVNDQLCTPTFTADLAAATLRLIRTQAFGLYHWTNAGECSWYQFACEIFRQAGLDVACIPITSQEFGARAARPTYSVLTTAKFDRLGVGQPRHWKEALRAYLQTKEGSGFRVQGSESGL